MMVSYEQMLVLVQSVPNGCVRIMDGAYPELSPEDPLNIMFLAPYSDLDTVIPDVEGQVPPQAVFGQEPEHTWCYFYQKAALSRQLEDWSAITTLYEEAQQNGFSPNNRIEWMPFLQAFVATGQIEELEPFASIMVEVPLIKKETCQILSDTAEKTRPEDGLMQEFIAAHFCP
jgi:hypothetical protein